MKRGPYTIISRKPIYKNPWIEVVEDKVLHPNGKAGIFGTINYQTGVSIVALNANHEIYLIKKYLYAIEEYGVELPSGGIDEKETPLEAAKRELREETGLISDNWTPLGYVHPFTMIIKSPAYLFLAQDVVQQEIIEDTQEGLVIVKKPWVEAFQMVLDNQITHAQSCVALLKTKILFDTRKDE